MTIHVWFYDSIFSKALCWLKNFHFQVGAPLPKFMLPEADSAQEYWTVDFSPPGWVLTINYVLYNFSVLPGVSILPLSISMKQTNC